MADRTINRMREQVRKRLYLMTLHAEEEMDNDGLTVYDVESIILTGQVIERQRDRKTGQRKYLVRGETVEGTQTAVVVSRWGFTDKLVIVTVYLD
ncbi:MAG TPA: DUF4258 domain-containing protein [Thermoanaerobaculia bacterium]|nr:DUF4258 domain-containing protein [Thermoanaerobaculia bacterium]